MTYENVSINSTHFACLEFSLLKILQTFMIKNGSLDLSPLRVDHKLSRPLSSVATPPMHELKQTIIYHRQNSSMLPHLILFY